MAHDEEYHLDKEVMRLEREHRQNMRAVYVAYGFAAVIGFFLFLTITVWIFAVLHGAYR